MKRKFLAAVVAASMLAGCILPAGTGMAYAKEPVQETETKDAGYAAPGESPEASESPEDTEEENRAEDIENKDNAEPAGAGTDADNAEPVMREKNLDDIDSGETAEGEAAPEEARPMEGGRDAELGGEAVLHDEITYINPLYKDVISEEDLNPLPEDGVAAYAALRYETDSNAVAGHMREAMASREGEFMLCYQSSQRFDQAQINTALNNWFSKALEETDNPHEGDYLHWNIGGYRARISYWQEGARWYYEYTVSVTYYTTAAQEREFDTKLTSLLNNLGVKGSALTDYEKAVKIYDYICDNVKYDYANLNNGDYMLKYTAYAALVNKTAVCQGYATLMYRMQEEAGIDTRVITGLGGGGPHAWNLTQLGSKYYLSDSTWDAEIKSAGHGYYFFLRGSSSFPDHTAGAYSSFINSYPVSAGNYAITGITLNKTSLSLTKRSKETLQVSIQPASAASGETVRWESSNPEIVTVSNGALAVKNFGTATITAYAGGRRAICSVEIKSCTGPHSWGDTPETGESATCVNDGYKGIFCTLCGELQEGSKEIIPAAGHRYKTSLTKATVTRNGSIITVCSACGTRNGSTVIYYPKTISLSGSSYGYSGRQQTPSVSVAGSDGRAISPSNYTVSYPGGRKDVGRYEVKISFRGNYSGTAVRTFDITPKGTSLSKLKKARKGFTAKWKAQKKQTSGYEVQYSTDKKFGKAVKTKTVKKNKTVSAKIGKLKAKKKYYVRVRTYKNVKVNGKSQKIYSGWSKTKSVKTK